MKRPALQNKQVGVLRMAFRARKVFGTFEKRAPGLMDQDLAQGNRPFAASDHVVQNRPCWRASSLLFPHWDIKTKASQASLVQVSLF